MVSCQLSSAGLSRGSTRKPHAWRSKQDPLTQFVRAASNVWTREPDQPQRTGLQCLPVEKPGHCTGREGAPSRDLLAVTKLIPLRAWSVRDDEYFLGQMPRARSRALQRLTEEKECM